MSSKAAPSTANTAARLTGQLEFGDQGVGSVPVDGDLALSSEGNQPWRSTLSTNALEAAERLWTRRQDARTLTEDEAIAITKVAFDVDLAFFGLEAQWGTARLAMVAGGGAVEVEAAVRPGAITR